LQRNNDPAIVAGSELTVTTAVVRQLPIAYVIVDMPAESPETTPEVLTVPTAGLLLLHVPPPGVAFNVVVLPIHTFIVPVIEAGAVFTVNGLIAKQPVANV